jgi:hypothetical protein
MAISTNDRKENRGILRFTWERFFVGFNVIIYISCVVLSLLPSVKAENAVLFFFGSSIGLYIFVMLSAVILNIFASPLRGHHGARKAISGLT